MHHPTYPAVPEGDVEAFAAYFGRWPRELSGIPRQVVEDWIYRHWDDFIGGDWPRLEPHTWSYELRTLSNAEVMSIGHVGTWIADFDAEGLEYVSGTPRSRTMVPNYMLTHGTFPVPILVAANAGHVVYPNGTGEHMKEPLQLIEGHRRLACLRGMINTQHPRTMTRHQAWVATIPGATA